MARLFNPAQQLNKVRTFAKENNMTVRDLLVNAFHLAHETGENFHNLIEEAEELFWDETNTIEYALPHSVL